MTLATTVTTLTDCDREPIHQLGRVQSFGALVAVNNDWIIAQNSTNFADIIGHGDYQLDDSGGLTGCQLDTIFTEDAIAALRMAARNCVTDDHIERRFGLALAGGGKLFDCAVHCSGRYTVIEFEPHNGHDLQNQIAGLGPLLMRLPSEHTVSELCAIATEEVRQIIGFDRVMVYKFHEDDTGEVIAEDHADGIESFFGLRYPKTDIPVQARELYIRNRFRIIADVTDDGAAIVPGASLDGEPLDLSQSVLRAVSPIHLEYLRNMGVSASLSISIVVKGKLWGLIACHNYEPVRLPYSQRTAAELISAIFSLNIERSDSARRAENEANSRVLHERLMRGFAAGSSVSANFDTIVPMLSSVIAFDGASVWIDKAYKSTGTAPSAQEFEAILPLLNTAETSTVIATQELAQQIPAAAKFMDRAAGAIIIPISRNPRDYIVLWRRELIRTVDWAGDPSKAKSISEDGTRMSPRKSFAAWQETVKGRSAPWAEQEIEAAKSVRISLLEVILRLTDEAVQERARSQEQQELLIAELNHRVRNILNLIRSLVSQSRHQAATIEEFSELISGRINALSNAHDNITRQNWTPAAFRSLLASEAEAYLAGKTDRVVIGGPAVMIAPEAFTVLALVIHEMVTNAAKYGSLCDSGGSLFVNLSIRDNGDLQIDWREEGGPPVSEPTRRGFGTTIIEKSIPFEIGGHSEVSYKKSGVEAMFVIPAKHITVADEDGAARLPKMEEPERGTADAAKIPERVLLVEDSMLIALDVQDCLEQAGVKHVVVVSTVARAEQVIAEQTFDLAILDFNLGDMTSEPVAELLRSLNTPFVLATGYGDLDDKLNELGAKQLLTKPYGKQEVDQLIADWNSF